MFLIEGKKLVQEAFLSNWDLESVIVREDLLDFWTEAYPQYSFTYAEAELFKQLSRMQQSEGILAVVRFPSPDFCSSQELETLPKGQGFMLEAIQDPGNLGTLMRSMDWMGIPNLILGPGCVDPLNLKSIRSSMGAIFRTKLRVVPDLASLVGSEPHRVCIADMEGTSVQEASFSSETYIVLGNEAKGISAKIKNLEIEKVSIPRIGKGESLNAGVAGSLIAWEMAKRNL